VDGAAAVRVIDGELDLNIRSGRIGNVVGVPARGTSGSPIDIVVLDAAARDPRLSLSAVAAGADGGRGAGKKGGKKGESDRTIDLHQPVSPTPQFLPATLRLNLR
jgi:hypothetical protein